MPRERNSSRAVSTPSRSPASLMSTTAKSGGSVLAASSASSPVITTPITSKPASVRAPSIWLAISRSSSMIKIRSVLRGCGWDAASFSGAQTKSRPRGNRDPLPNEGEIIRSGGTGGVSHLKCTLVRLKGVLVTSKCPCSCRASNCTSISPDDLFFTDCKSKPGPPSST
jgi:hypothetical protein